MRIFELLLALYALKIIVYFLLMLMKNAGAKEKTGVGGMNATLSVDIVLPMYNEEKVV
jgi:hypothetical protein